MEKSQELDNKREVENIRTRSGRFFNWAFAEYVHFLGYEIGADAEPNTRQKVITEGLIGLAGYLANPTYKDERALEVIELAFIELEIDELEEPDADLSDSGMSIIGRVLMTFLNTQTVHGGYSAYLARLAEEIERSLRGQASKGVNTAVPPQVGVGDELMKYVKLLQDGHLTEEEFAGLKQTLLQSSNKPPQSTSSPTAQEHAGSGTAESSQDTVPDAHGSVRAILLD